MEIENSVSIFDIPLSIGLPRLRNFVNVYTNSRNRNDSVYMQSPY